MSDESARSTTQSRAAEVRQVEALLRSPSIFSSKLDSAALAAKATFRLPHASMPRAHPIHRMRDRDWEYALSVLMPYYSDRLANPLLAFL